MTEACTGPAREALYAAATAALERAYAPYSKFLVGAALRALDGSVVTAGNMENAAYPQTICAERCAYSIAIAAGQREFTDLAIAFRDTRNPGATGVIRPCGGCLSVMQEFSPTGDLWVHCLDQTGASEIVRLRELLPLPFVLNSPQPPLFPQRK